MSTVASKPRLKTSAPTRVRFGLLLNTDFTNSAFSLRTSINKTQMNALRGEWKTQIEVGQSDYLTTQWYQPLDYAGRFFVMPAAGVQRQAFNLFVDESAIGRYVVDDVFAGLQGGISFGPLGQLAVGLRRDWYKYKENISFFPAPEATQNQTALVAELNLDQIDNVAFPRSGWLANVQFTSAGSALGGDWSFNRLTARGGWAKSLSEWTFVLSANGTTKIGNNSLPYVEAGFLGGFLNLSGLQPLQLWGNYSAIGRVVVYKRLIKLPSLIGTGVYLGGSFETGNAWLTSDQIKWDNLRFAGSLYVGADTLLGPLYFAYGMADRGNHSFYLALGLPLAVSK